jgi:6-pyruvoyltetrahydropterin/6-carboxytetrahydropterin synthase
MYRVTREIDFCYGHRLLNYEGKCRHLHGHNGRAVVVLESDVLDQRGMLVDFNDIKRELQRWIDEHLDHTMLLCRDDPILPLLQARDERVFVMDHNPTAENIARLIFDRAVEAGLPVVEVILWETDHCHAAYRTGS